ncbi:unnamed protein product [Acanthocheilonema viteae]|uniref:Uncharacterized protein n=1 Tax=Acanthocheilonema viteae TaxID=6277 RepID=A0A498SII4_ACAVI|nr:unnamed protein product [Acanthocheilonema viteae]
MTHSTIRWPGESQVNLITTLEKTTAMFFAELASRKHNCDQKRKPIRGNDEVTVIKVTITQPENTCGQGSLIGYSLSIPTKTS